MSGLLVRYLVDRAAAQQRTIEESMRLHHADPTAPLRDAAEVLLAQLR